MERIWILLTGISAIVLGLRGMAIVLHPIPGATKRLPIIYPFLCLGGGLALAAYGLLA